MSVFLCRVLPITEFTTGKMYLSLTPNPSLVTSTAVLSNAVVLLLFIHCVMVFPLLVEVLHLVLVLLCDGTAIGKIRHNSRIESSFGCS